MGSSMWGIPFLIGMSAFFSCMEAAFVSMDRVTVRRFQKSDGVLEKIISRYLQNLDFFLVSTLLGNLIINILIVWSTQDFLQVLSVYLPRNIDSIFLILLQSLFLLVVCDVTPKRLGIRYSRFLGYGGCIPMLGFYILTYPVSKTLLVVKNWIERVLRMSKEFWKEEQEEQEILDYIRNSYEQGVLGESEGNILYNFVAYREAFIDSVLITRMNMKGLDLENLPTKLSKWVFEFPHEVIPVYKKVTDNIVGVLDKRKLFLKGDMKNLQHSTLKKYIDSPHIITDSSGLVDVFSQMCEQGTKLSVVVDEYGGVAGIVTYKDISSVLLGKSTEEQRSYFSLHKEGEYCCIEGSMDLVYFNKMFTTSLYSDKVNTVGGYILELIGDIPVRGDKFELEGVIVSVEEVTKRGIRLLKVQSKRTK